MTGMAAYRAICSTLPEDAPLWPLQRQGGKTILIRIEAAVLDRLRAMRRPGESYSDVHPQVHSAEDWEPTGPMSTMASERQTA